MHDWATPGMKEYPFWRNDMTIDEFDKEREYYLKNFEQLVLTGKYVPLWKQNIATCRSALDMLY